MTTTESLAARLASLPTLTGIPREQLTWLVEHGEFLRARDGDEIHAQSFEALPLYLLISGRFSIRVDQGGVVREVREVLAGRPTGFLPYSRMVAARGYVVADGPVEFLRIEQADIPEMTRNCYDFTALCVHEMLDRVRVFKGDDKEQEKMAALGRLSAGLAHELNNPASAVARAAEALGSACAEQEAAARALGAAALDLSATRAVEQLEAASPASESSSLRALERADLEDRLTSWLDDHGLEPDLAYPLLDAGITPDRLDGAADALDSGQLAVALRHLAAGAVVRDLSATIVSAANRIHSLVAAVKKHTHMDRAPASEPILLSGHLADTMAFMRAKASLKEVVLDLSVQSEDAAVEGSVADLNQVWMHLVDNAVDAATGPGRVLIDVARHDDVVVVRVVDDGPGVPSEIQERIFEPFYTTKQVGQGRGLGLDIVRTVVQRHRGTVHLASSPGHTEFRVTLPAVPASNQE